MARRRLNIVALFVDDGLFEIADTDSRVVVGLGIEMASAVQAIKGAPARPLNPLSGRMLSVVVELGNRGIVPSHVGEHFLRLGHDWELTWFFRLIEVLAVGTRDKERSGGIETIITAQLGRSLLANSKGSGTCFDDAFSDASSLGQAVKCPLGAAEARRVVGLEQNEDQGVS